jgi:NRPS condensation-like uncharacterized protein
MLPRPAARIAAYHDGGRTGHREPGYGFQLVIWPNVPVVPAGEDGLRPTVNDVLVTAMIIAVARWNLFHGKTSDRIRITMPLGARPAASGGPHASGGPPGTGGGALGNLSSLASVTAQLPGNGTGVRNLLADVARQTQYAKARPMPQVDPISRGFVAAWLPARVKHRLARAALRTLGPLHCDTSLVSNLGDIADPPRFGHAVTTRMWFSTVAHMPRGLSVGVITVRGQVHLCLRYRHALLDEQAAAQFGRRYLAALAALTVSGGEW